MFSCYSGVVVNGTRRQLVCPLELEGARRGDVILAKEKLTLLLKAKALIEGDIEEREQITEEFGTRLATAREDLGVSRDVLEDERYVVDYKGRMHYA